MVTSIMALRGFRQWCSTRRGNVAMLAALLIPAMTGAAGLGIEVSNWNLQQIELQHYADAAALAAAITAKSGANTQTSLNAGADIAELNGIPGAATRTWDGSNNIISDNQITMKRVTGISDSSNFAYQAALTKPLTLVITKLITDLSTVTVSATGYAENVTTKVKACIMLLGSSSTSLTLDNNAAITMPGCAVETNGSVNLYNNASMSTNGLTAAGTITLRSGATISGTTKSGAGTFTDPYSADAAVQAVITSANSASGSLMSGSGNFYPGSYSGMTFANGVNATLNAGLYLVHGNISTDNNVTITGTGVTIVFTGTGTFSNNTTVTLSAPTAGAATGVPGVALIGTNSANLSFTNNANLIATGVVYYPNGKIDASNNFGASGSNCSVIIALSMHVANNAWFANTCSSSSGVKNLYAPVGNGQVTLVK